MKHPSHIPPKCCTRDAEAVKDLLCGAVIVLIVGGGLLAVFLCGCASVPAKRLTTEQRDRLHFNAPDVSRAVVNYRASSLVAPVVYSRTLAYRQPEPVLQSVIEEAPTIFGPWSEAYVDDPGLWIGPGEKQVTFPTQYWNGYFRVRFSNNSRPL